MANQVGGMGEVERLHRDWTLANLLDGKVAEPEWNYRNFELGGTDSEFTTIQDGIKFYNAEVGGNMPLDAQERLAQRGDRAVGRLLPQLLRQRARACR